ncbi:MAG: methyltransferase domain-containing protein [Spirochaetales bacterium]|nr:methyltransferase domain-containing protein [Spirochaetales bacterium]
MDRRTWLKKLQRLCEERYDIDAHLYNDGKYGLYSNTTHQQYMQEFLKLLAPGGMILDAACGAGRYLPFLLEKKSAIIAIDQSQGMLAQAKKIFPGVQFEKASLQEMTYLETFDGAICIDAMENVCPEDWPLVLGNFYRALKPDGYLYFTVETMDNADEKEIKEAFEKAKQSRLPIVYGEWPDEDGVYHFHPSNQRVQQWSRRAGFKILKEGNGEKWYYHILVQKGQVIMTSSD